MLNPIKTTAPTPKDLTPALIRDPIAVSPETPVREAIALMSGVRSPCDADAIAQAKSNPGQLEAHASCVLVLESRRIIGILTERDVVLLCVKQQCLDDLCIGQVMTTSVLKLKQSALSDLFVAINFLQQNHIKHLPIVDEQDDLVGLVTYETLLQTLQQSCYLELEAQEQVAAQLRQSTQRLQEAQRIARLGNWELDIEQNTLYWSEQVFRIFEIDSQQFGASYEAFLNLVHPDDQAIVNQAYTNHLSDHQPYSLVHRLQMADGRIKYVQEQCETTYSAEGTPLISWGTVQDITQQQQAEIQCNRAEASLRQVIEGTAPVTGEAFFPALVRHISEALGVRYVSVSQAMPDGFQVLAFFANGEFCLPPFLPYEAVPCCLQSLKTGSFCQPAGIQALYPENTLFADLEVDSYLGVGLRNTAGDPIGNLAILHDAPLADPDWANTLLKILAARAGAELERLLTAQALEQLNAELEERVTQRTAELAEREALLQDFLDNANDLIQMVSIETGRFEFVNRAWRETLGYTAAEVEQLNIFDVLAPDCLNHCQQMMQQMRDGSLSYLKQAELKFINKLGQKVLLSGNINCRVERDAEGQQRVLSTRAILRDITVTKAAEQELQQREARYRGLMEGAADAILLADLQGNILEANQKAEELLGYPLAELTTLHFTQLHPPEELSRLSIAFAEIAQQQRTRILDVICSRRDGSIVPVDITASVLNIGGELLVQGIFRDISDRKQIETALRESQQFLQTILDTVPLAVFWKDRSSNYLGANQRFLRDASLSSASELIGKTDLDLPWGATEAKDYRADDRAVIDSGEAKLSIIETLHRQDGTELWLETNKLPLRNLAGEVVGVLCTYQDITERQNAEIALQRQLAAVEAAINGIAILEDEHFVYLNSSHVQLFGYQSNQELIGKSWRILYSEQELERFDREIFPVLSMQKFWQGEVIATRQDGTTFPEQLSLTLSAENLVICVCEDISDRKQAERDLQDSETRFRRVFESNVVGMFFTNFSGQVTDANDRFLNLIGYSRADLEAHRINWAQITPPEYVEADQQAIAILQRNGEIVPWEKEYLRLDGSRISVLIGVAMLSQVDGRCVCVVLDISDRKQAEAALRESERRYGTLTQAVPVAIFRFDLQGQCIYVNERWCEMTQKPLAFALDDRWLETIHPDDRERSQALTQQWLQSGAVTPFQHEARILRDDGSIVWYYCQILREFDSNGEMIGYVGTLTDISDRQAAESLIRQQANRETLIREITQRIRQSLDLQTIFDTACQEIRQVLQADRVGIFKFQADSNWNDGEFVAESRVEGVVSAMAIQIHDHCFGEKYAPLYLQGRYAAMEDIYQLQSECHTDVLTQFQVRANLVIPLLDGDSLWGLLCVHQCREPRQWQSAEVVLSQQLAAQLAIAIQQANLFQQLQQELAERQKAQNQLTKINQQLAVSNAELERATRLKDEFLANMSHELRTPLNAILGMTEGLQEEVFGIVNEKQLKALNTVEKSASHLLSLINDILDVAKIESGQAKLDFRHVSVKQLCSSSLTFVKQQALGKRIHLETKISPHLTDLLIDEIRMRQVLLNLLTNAVKFTLEGGTVTLTASLLPPELPSSQISYLRIAITDTGIGIAPENITKLFQPFVQVDSALNRKYAGTGLGLSLVKKIVELHGGHVGLTSELGVGSCFTIDLPYQPQLSPHAHSESSAIAHQANPSHANASQPEPSQAPVVLVAEDNPANVATLSSYLEAKGYRLLLANNGQEAIDLAMSHHPDIILMDVQMPEVDGLTAMQQIRQQESLRNIPIIALTALAMMGDRDRCLAAGANCYLSKPVKLKQLDLSIQELLADRSFE